MLRTAACLDHISMFFLCALVKWSHTFLWEAATKTLSIWASVKTISPQKKEKKTKSIPFIFVKILEKENHDWRPHKINNLIKIKRLYYQ